ncbi:unnamed protein product [Euphydryas editha]|uniref:Uncharacterized protein n=1 Tax=Euphydryas editha TaxID=104508 RepID=A0AAU9UUG7_EUPED|nr:unnamed protein product [Euphydryas editha]
MKIMFVSGVCDVAGGAGSVNALPASGGARLAPSFDAATPRNVTALVGKSAYLSCRVRNLGNRTEKGWNLIHDVAPVRTWVKFCLGFENTHNTPEFTDHEKHVFYFSYTNATSKAMGESTDEYQN